MSLVNIKRQQGMGIVEVMMALLLLAVAVLGFSAMQLTAVKATDESLMRTRALAIMRGGAENMRGYANGISSFGTALNGKSDKITIDGKSVTKNSCLGNDKCTPQQLAAKDGMILRDFASTQGISLGLHNCPGTDVARGQIRRCMIASWDTTTATFGTGRNDCASNATGVQNPGTSCFVMEAY